ncbi:hypothetical protein [Paraburkholderia solisilvae]|uniref:Uncharacterized protein n=1 Tax=Paraburkholderia solisilvae TaxID=624376 RepID=A0A6J5DIK2_9BURK|nr:hypothetical protein [Paraburkholderia solisilvae]CAB3753071.1 hypothetical protein LMG29739_01659 [Paraburkholderia solisilvae]
MSNQQPRRVLGLKPGYESRARALAVEQREFHRKQSERPAACGDARPAHANGKRPQGKPVDPAQLWSMPFETRALLIIEDPKAGDKTGRMYHCQHVRGDGAALGRLLVRLPFGAPTLQKGTSIEAAGTVATRANGRFAPLVSMIATRWTARPAK